MKGVTIFDLIHFVISLDINVKHRHSVRLALSIKGINFIVLHIVERFDGEVLGATFDIDLDIICNCLGSWVEKELVMHDVFIVEQIHKNKVIIHEATGDKWIWEIVDGHGVAI